MKRLLNTLYVTTDGAYLAKEGETVVVRVEGNVRLRVPIHNLSGIVCFGRVGCSPFLLGFCGRKGVGVTFLSEYGRFLARAVGETSGNVLLRREQYRRADDPQTCARLVRAIVGAKVTNSRAVLARGAREREGEAAEALTNAAAELRRILGEIRRADAVDTLRGLEGLAAKAYFGVFDHLIAQQKEDFRFTGRNRRPPRDNINALLSFLYTLLYHDMTSACEGVGLDPAVGFLHRDRPGRSGLALDLMEELRAPFADRLALTLVNTQQVTASGFCASESGGISMDDATRKTVLVAYQKRKQDELTHPFLQEKAPFGLVGHLQALLLARHLRGDLDDYPPFIPR